MPALRDLQRQLAVALLARAPERVAGAVREGRLPAFDRVQLYQNNVHVGLAAALADVYPVVQRLVGDAFFGFIARNFMRVWPSRSGNLHDFGRELPAYLAELWEARTLEYLPDVAALEWALHEVFHAAEPAPLDADALARVPASDQGELRFHVHPATRLLASRFPVLAIWQANQQDEPPPVDAHAGATDLLRVARRDYAIRIDRLAPGEFALLAALEEGGTLLAACAAAQATDTRVDICAAMTRFVADGSLVGFHTRCH